jgi:hypothetical protein
MLGGHSALDTLDDALSGQLTTGTDTSGLFTGGWQSTIGTHTVVRQRVYFVGQDLVTTLKTGETEARSSNASLGYRAEVLHATLGGLLASGAEVVRQSGVRESTSTALAAGLDAGHEVWMTHAAYVDFSRPVGRRLSLEAGARLSDSSLVHHGAVSPWILGAWRPVVGWTVSASAGASRQFPDLDAVLGAAGSQLVPERATHADLGIEQQLVTGLRWQVTFFRRVEEDVLRAPNVSPPIVGTVPDAPQTLSAYRNALSGVSQGVELTLTPARIGMFSGWVSYSYARTQQRDTATQETFASDVDLRHTLSGVGSFRLGAQTSAAFVLRAASGLPIPGYFGVRNGTLVVSDQLNAVRLPSFVRIDARVQRRLLSMRHQVTVFGEVLNALNHQDEGVGIGIIQPTTATALGLSPSLVPRRVSAGIRIDWSR